MENIALPSEQEQLYRLLVQANEKQTLEIKTEIQESQKLANQEIDKVKKEIEIIKTKNLELERKARKNNILLFGAKIQTEELLEGSLKLLNNLIGTKIEKGDINNIYRIGKGNNPPIVLEFVTYLKKITLFSDKEKLKLLKHHGISISNDLCTEDREDQKILRRHLKLARVQKFDAKIRNYKLYINNTPYTADELRIIENKAEDNNSSEDITSGEEELSEVELEEEKIVRQETSRQTPNNIKETSAGTQQPLAEKKSTKTPKKKRTKLLKYSPKNTRSKKN